MNFIAGLNYRSTIARQDNKCKKCGIFIDPDKESLYFRMDQTIGLYEVFCPKCGIEEEKKDRQKRRKITNDV